MRAVMLLVVLMRCIPSLAQEEPQEETEPIPVETTAPTDAELNELFQQFQSEQPTPEEGISIQQEVVKQVEEGQLPPEELQEAIKDRIDEAGGTFSSPVLTGAAATMPQAITFDRDEIRSLTNTDVSELTGFPIEPGVSFIIAAPEEVVGTEVVGDIELEPASRATVPDEAEVLPSFTPRKPRRGPRPFDSRFDLRELDPENPEEHEILLRAEAVALVVERAALTRVGANIYTLDLSHRLGQVQRLCPSEPFAEQPVTGLGTAFLLEGDVFMTADHVMPGDPKRYAVVFGYEMKTRSGVVTWAVSTFDVFFPTRIVERYGTEDLLLFQVDRSTGRQPLRWVPSKRSAAGERVYMIGHPMGLPKKVALNSSIRDATAAEYFYTTLDAFAGNSGSPVLSLRTHAVIGVLVAGAQDYVWNGSCNESALCRMPYCEGEKVMRIELVTDRLTELAQRSQR